MKTKTKVKAGVKQWGLTVGTLAAAANHNETQMRDKAPAWKVQTNVKAGALTANHNEVQVRDKAPGFKVKTNVTAGAPRDAASGLPTGK